MADSQTVKFTVKNARTEVLTVVLEPWANEYRIEPGVSCDVVEQGGNPTEAIELHIESDTVTVFARAGATMLVLVDGVELA